VDAFRASLSEQEQVLRIRAISDFIVAELPFLVAYGTAWPLAVRTGVKALDDYDGGGGGGAAYGTYTRNAHLWDID
jgi:hypothetical protein